MHFVALFTCDLFALLGMPTSSKMLLILIYLFINIGYLTNTGIKLMILIENIYMNPEDGTPFRQDNSNTLLPSLSISDGSGGSGSRETDLKNMFVS